MLHYQGNGFATRSHVACTRLMQKHRSRIKRAPIEVEWARRIEVWATSEHLHPAVPCSVEGTWQAFWRGLGEKIASPLSNPTALIARALQTSSSTHYPRRWALLLLRPHSGASSTCDSVNRVTFGNKRIFLAGFENVPGWRANMQVISNKMVSCLMGDNNRILFSLFSMTRLGNAKKVVLSRCRLLVNMTSGIKLSYYRGNTKT